MEGYPVAIFDYAFTSRYDLALDAGRSTDDEGTLQNYTWQISGFPDLAGPNVAVEFPGDGDYLVTLQVTDEDGLTDSATLAFRLAPPYRHFNTDPVAMIEADSNGTHAQLDASASSDPDEDALTYSWFVDGKPAGEGARLAHYFPVNGEFEVALLASDPYGGTGVAVQHVHIDGAEPPHVMVDLWSGAFLDEPVFLDASRTWSREEGPLQFHWTVEGQSVTSTEPLLIFQPSEAGDLVVRLSVTTPSGEQAEHTEELHIVDWWSLFAGEAPQDMRTKVSVSSTDTMSAMRADPGVFTGELSGPPMLMLLALALVAVGSTRRPSTRL